MAGSSPAMTSVPRLDVPALSAFALCMSLERRSRFSLGEAIE